MLFRVIIEHGKLRHKYISFDDMKGVAAVTPFLLLSVKITHRISKFIPRAPACRHGKNQAISEKK